MAPTFLEIDHSLSLRMPINLFVVCAMLLSASNDMPLVSAASPKTQTTFSSLPSRSRAAAMPSAADMAVPACPAPKLSCSLSVRSAKPFSPSVVRMLRNRSFRPVSSLCTYDWWLTSHTNLSFGVSNTRCIATVNSTTPRFGPRCPPCLAKPWINSSLNSSASFSSCAIVSFLTWAGLSTMSR